MFNIREFYGIPVKDVQFYCDCFGNPYGTMTLYLDDKNIERIKKMTINYDDYKRFYEGSYSNIGSVDLSMLLPKDYDCESRIKRNKEDKIIFNESKKATTVLWKDGTKTIVKASKDDKFDKRIGYLMAFYQKHCGMSKTKANKYIDNLCAEEIIEKKEIEMIDVSEKGN